ncbi:MAG TPA: 16S rRNA (guanine(966)-N(2))-methyltransferase RsmD [Acidimicrobiales bacterium]|jgi:16S rRNA (guanine966-N2)-methyltransferase|nr:16S rRNA (guanine(966)-N(2))-methyltransferase RsmD [Acidimicrobiales bacterium]
MRVVAGTAGGRHLQAPSGHTTRPTSDRVREATFNALGSLGVVDGAELVDLFAGSGAMGIEALSRGGAHATFVDSDRRARRAIETNLQSTGLDDRAVVVGDDVLAFLRMTERRFDLALLDPPYAFDGWAEVLAALTADVAVLESDRPIEPGGRWSVVRSRPYGTTVVTICRRNLADPQEITT